MFSSYAYLLETLLLMQQFCTWKSILKAMSNLNLNNFAGKTYRPIILFIKILVNPVNSENVPNAKRTLNFF